MTLFLRFLVGGIFVSLFSVLGDSFKPKSFAGLFAAAPSIALAGLILIWLEDGRSAVAISSYWMAFGSIALILYGASCSVLVRKTRLKTWLIAGLLWIEWLAVSLLFYKAI